MEIVSDAMAKWRTRAYTWSSLTCFGLFIAAGMKLMDGPVSF
jgi:hypothetical protein